MNRLDMIQGRVRFLQRRAGDWSPGGGQGTLDRIRMFTLHPRLAEDTVPLGRFELSLVRLMDDARYPWFLLVPRVPDAREIYRLAAADQQRLLAESGALCRWMERELRPDKLNLAALGNVVPQLHVHHVARYADDAAWPRPVWGVHPPLPYAPAAREALVARFLARPPEGFVPDGEERA